MFNIFSKKSLLLQALLSTVLVGSAQANVHPSPIKLTKTGPLTADLGETVQYTITAINEGDKPICHIELHDFVSPCACESPFVKATDDSHFGFVFEKTPDGFTAHTKHKLAPGKSFQITAYLRACKPVGSILTNTIRFLGKQDGDCVIGCASAETKLGKCPGALRVHVTPESVFACPGGTFKLTAHVENSCGKILYHWFELHPKGDIDEESLLKEGAVTLDGDKPASAVGTWEAVDHRDHATLKVTVPVEACPSLERCLPIRLPSAVYVVVIEDTCTGCKIISRPVFLRIAPCADLAVHKRLVSQLCDRAIFEIIVTNHGPCTAFGGTIVVQDCLPKGLELEPHPHYYAEKNNWRIRVVNCHKEECIQAVYTENLPAGESTPPFFIETRVHCCDDIVVNSATVYSTCIEQFDCNLSNNTSSASAKCVKKKQHHHKKD